MKNFEFTTNFISIVLNNERKKEVFDYKGGL